MKVALFFSCKSNKEILSFAHDLVYDQNQMDILNYAGQLVANGHSEQYARMGLRYQLNEYRAF